MKAFENGHSSADAGTLLRDRDALSPDLARSLYEKVLRLRLVELEVAARYGDQEMRCPVHLSVGQEATPVGVAACLSPEDYMVSAHRAHAHYLAKGGDLKAMLCELYGKEAGCTGGQGGSMHLIDLACNFLGSTSIVGGTIPVGVGAAFTSRLKNEDRVTVVCLGDTAIEEGVFHESMNFASLHKLNVLFMCENNGYSCYSPLRNRQPDRPLVDVGKAHKVFTAQVDGSDVASVYEKTRPIVDAIRAGQGPAFVEYKTFRFLEHCGHQNDDHLGYRTPAEIEEGKRKDAVKVARAYLERTGGWDEAWAGDVEEAIRAEIREAFAFAKQAPFPGRDKLGAFTYAK